MGLCTRGFLSPGLSAGPPGTPIRDPLSSAGTVGAGGCRRVGTKEPGRLPDRGAAAGSCCFPGIFATSQGSGGLNPEKSHHTIVCVGETFLPPCLRRRAPPQHCPTAASPCHGTTPPWHHPTNGIAPPRRHPRRGCLAAAQVSQLSDVLGETPSSTNPPCRRVLRRAPRQGWQPGQS